MMLIRGDLERKVRGLIERDQQRARQVVTLWEENAKLRGQVAEMERTLQRDQDYLHG
jgi:hypothetical protein